MFKSFSNSKSFLCNSEKEIKLLRELKENGFYLKALYNKEFNSLFAFYGYSDKEYKKMLNNPKIMNKNKQFYEIGIYIDINKRLLKEFNKIKVI
jgi:hypothetical protein